MCFYKVILLFLFAYNYSWSQQLLRISGGGIGSGKVYDVFTGDVIEYKVKGERKFWKNKIFAFKDSVIFFEDDSFVKFTELKCLRVKTHKRLVSTFRALFIRAGILFIFLDTANNLILERPQVVNEKAVVISSSLLLTGLFFKLFETKKIRINKHKTLKVLELNYQNLNQKN